MEKDAVQVDVLHININQKIKTTGIFGGKKKMAGRDSNELHI